METFTASSLPSGMRAAAWNDLYSSRLDKAELTPADQDSELHDMIARGSGNSLIQESLARLHTHLHIFRLRFHSEVTREAYVEHAKLIEALKQRRPAAAEAAMRTHIEKSYKRMAPFTDA